MEHVAQILGEVEIRLFGFIFQSQGPVVSPEETVGPAYVRQIAVDTGGTIVSYPVDKVYVFQLGQEPALLDKSGKPTQLGSLLGSQYRQISSFYRVDIDVPETVDKPREWKLDLVGFSKSQREKLVLRYPHMLVPCH